MKRKVIVKIFLVCMLCVPMFALSGCSSIPDGKELLQEVIDEMNDVKSMKMEMDMLMKMKMSMAGGSVSMEMDMEADMDVTNDPIAYHGELETNMKAMGEKESKTIEMYMIMDGYEMNQYQNDGTGWVSTSESMPISDFSRLYLMDDKMLDKLEIKVKNGKKVDEKETYQIDVTINKETFKEMMKEQDTSFDLDDLKIDDFSLTYSMFVDKDSKRILAMNFDFKDQLSELFSKALLQAELPEGSSVTFDEFSINAKFSDYNKVDEIELPEEVLNAINGGDSQFIQHGDVSTQTHAWESGKVNAAGTEITLNETTLQTLLDAGFKIDESMEVANTIDEYGSEYLTLIKDDIELYIGVDNKANTSIHLNEGVITYLSTFALNEKVSLPNGISKGASKEAVIAAYGEANTMDTEYFDSWEYLVEEDVYKSLSLEFEDDVLSGFSIGFY